MKGQKSVKLQDFQRAKEKIAPIDCNTKQKFSNHTCFFDKMNFDLAKS